MSTMMTLEVIQDYMPNGYVDSQDIYDKMFITWNTDESYKKSTILEMYTDLGDSTKSIPTFGDMAERCDIINSDCITQLAINDVLDYMHNNKLDLEEITEEDFLEKMEENEYCIMDSLGYNNSFNIEQTLMKVAEEEGLALVIHPYDNFYDDLMYGYDLSSDEDLEIILNHAQQVMFPELYDQDTVERMTDSSLFKYSGVYVEREAETL